MPTAQLSYNFLVLALAALIPLIIGFVWYNPKVFGDAPRTDEERKALNMPVIIICSYVFCFFLAFGLQFAVIHQFHIASTLAHQADLLNQKGTPINNFYVDFMNKYGHEFRTYRHGAFHGFLAGLTFSLPIVGMKALFDGKGFKYIAINVGFWLVNCMLMGAVICHWT